MRGKKEADLLQKTYHDRLTVVRKRLGRDPQTQESVELEEVVYKDVLCALSQSGNNKPDRQEFHSERQMGAVLFTPRGSCWRTMTLRWWSRRRGRRFRE